MNIRGKLPAERIVAENTAEAVRLRFHRLTSRALCRRMLAERHPALEAQTLDLKAEGVAWSVGSALGYWETEAKSLNAKALMRYYALLQITIAEEVASADPIALLANVQKHSEQGHGLFTIGSPEVAFPDNYFIGCTKQGHFPAYCRSRQLELDAVSFDGRARHWGRLDESSRLKLISLCDLLCRVPELQTVVKECLGKSPLSFHIHHSSKNMGARGTFGSTPTPAGATSDKSTFVDIYADWDMATADWLSSLGLPFTNITPHEDDRDNRYFIGEFRHSAEGYWWQHLELYKSGYTGTSIIAPFWNGIADPLVLHFVILYSLSIIVRYLPSLWHDIENGALDNIRVLLEHYLAVVDQVVPLLAIERIANVRLLVTQPGSLFAPA